MERNILKTAHKAHCLGVQTDDIRAFNLIGLVQLPAQEFAVGFDPDSVRFEQKPFLQRAHERRIFSDIIGRRSYESGDLPDDAAVFDDDNADTARPGITF